MNRNTKFWKNIREVDEAFVDKATIIMETILEQDCFGQFIYNFPDDAAYKGVLKKKGSYIQINGYQGLGRPIRDFLDLSATGFGFQIHNPEFVTQENCDTAGCPYDLSVTACMIMLERFGMITNTSNAREGHDMYVKEFSRDPCAALINSLEFIKHHKGTLRKLGIKIPTINNCLSSLNLAFKETSVRLRALQRQTCEGRHLAGYIPVNEHSFAWF